MRSSAASDVYKRQQYQKIGNSEFLTIGYDFSLINWKK
jgi:hypothetical protein